MEVNYQLTVDDFRRAIKAYRTRTPFLRWTVRLGVGFTILVLATGAIGLVLAPHSGAFHNLIPLYIVFILWTIIFWASPYRSARSQFRGSPSAKAPVTLDVTDAGLHFRSQHTDSKVGWSAYVKWLEEKTIFALFPNPKLFIVIPKRAFTVEQMNEFRELLREYVKPQL
jgi:hypothetical protein